MTNTAWQQKTPVRRPSTPQSKYLQEGVPNTYDPDPDPQAAPAQLQIGADGEPTPVINASQMGYLADQDPEAFAPGMVGVTNDSGAQGATQASPDAATPNNDYDDYPTTPASNQSLGAPAIAQDPKHQSWMERIWQKATEHPGAAAAQAQATAAAANPNDPYGNLEKILGQRPIQQAPNWLERIAAGGIGAAAGYSNAARRAAPIDIGKVTQGILHPGYEDKLAAWQSRVIPAQQIVEMHAAAAKNAAEIKDKEADAAWKMGLGRTTMYTVTPEFAAATGNRYHVGQQIPSADAAAVERSLRAAAPTKIAVTPMEKYKELKAAFPTKTDEELWQAVVNPTMVGKPDPQARNINPVDVLLHPGDFTPDQVKTARELFDKEHRPPQSSVVNNFSGTPGANGQVDPLIKAIGDYESLPPTPRSSSPASVEEYRRIVAAVKQYNIHWDQKNYAVVQNGLKDFGSGRTAQTIDALNQVSAHLLALDDAATALKNNDVNALNRIGNTWGLQMGTSGGNAVAKYNTIVHRVGPELGKAYGTATEGENNVNQADFDASRGPDLIHGAIASSAQLLNAKIDALHHRWDTNVKRYNPGREFDAVSPMAVEAFNRLSGGGQQQQAPPLPMVLSASDKGKTFLNKQGHRITVTEINPQNPKLFKFQAAP